jgi:uncharacterized membrane protein
MIRRVIHFLAVLAAGVITGGQYVVSFDYSGAGTTAPLYTEKMQYAIHHIGTPLFTMLIATTILSFLAAVLYRSDRRTSLLLAVAGSLFLCGGLITAFGNVPLLNMIDTWNVSSPPSDWREVADRWYVFHTVRIFVDLVGFALVIISVFVRREDLR